LENVKKEIRRVNEPILVLEDKPENQLLLTKLLENEGMTSVVVSNGKEGLEAAEKQKFSIYIVDLMMPVMDGKTFIREMKQKKPDSIFLVQSAIDTTDEIIEIMRMGVFDYIIKPIDINQFQRALIKALEYYDLKETEKQLSSHSGMLLRNQLEWLTYKESRRRTDQNSSEMLSIQNLRTSLSQGSGVGAMVTLVDLMKSSLIENGETYIVNKPITDLLIQNAEVVRTLLSGLESISAILETDVQPAEMMASDLIKKLPDILKEVYEYLPQKNMKLTFPELKMDTKLKIDMSSFAQAFEEIVINAYKYGLKDSSIDIFTFQSGAYFCLAVKNDVQEKPYGGIPHEYEKLVLEPFFRLLPPEESAGRLEKFGLGLGLTIVEHVMRKHNGLFSIHDVKDHTGTTIKSSVVAEMFLPFES